MVNYRYGYIEFPEMLHKELRVAASAEQVSITPASGKRIRVYAMHTSITITSAVTSTLRASVSFGTGGVSDATKVLWSARIISGGDTQDTFLGGINVIGAVNETVTLTNITYSAGTAVTRAIIYYKEE